LGSPSSEVGMTLESSQTRTADDGTAHAAAQELVETATMNAAKTTARFVNFQALEWSRQDDCIIATPRLCSDRKVSVTPSYRKAAEPNDSSNYDKRTIWRRERDSNPRYRFRYSGFQVHRRVLIRHENSLLYMIFQLITKRTS
jgi:hypothetical protein